MSVVLAQALFVSGAIEVEELLGHMHHQVAQNPESREEIEDSYRELFSPQGLDMLIIV